MGSAPWLHLGGEEERNEDENQIPRKYTWYDTLSYSTGVGLGEEDTENTFEHVW